MADGERTTVPNTDEILMSNVQQFRCIYDKQLKEHKDQRMKANAWKMISENVGMPVENCMKRYNNIRTQFAKYLKSINPPSGSGRDKVILKPEYEHLRWLICHIKHRDTISNFSRADIGSGHSGCSVSTSSVSSEEGHCDGITEISENSQPEEIKEEPFKNNVDDSSSDTVHTKSKSTVALPKAIKKKRTWARQKMAVGSETDQAILETINQLKTEKVEKEDEEYLFCSSVAMKMRRLSPYQKSVAQMQILQVLNEVEWSLRPQPNGNHSNSYQAYHSAVHPGFDQQQFGNFMQSVNSVGLNQKNIQID